MHKITKNFYITQEQDEWIRNHKEINIQEKVRGFIDSLMEKTK